MTLIGMIPFTDLKFPSSKEIHPQESRACIQRPQSTTSVTNIKGVQEHQSSYGLYFYQQPTIFSRKTSQDQFPLYSGMHGSRQSINK